MVLRHPPNAYCLVIPLYGRALYATYETSAYKIKQTRLSVLFKNDI